MKRVFAFFLCMAFLAAVGCSAATEIDTESALPLSSMRSTTLCYANSDGLIIPVVRSIPWDEGIAVSALSYLIATPENEAECRLRGLCACIPEGTGFSLKINDEKRATLDVRHMPTLPDENTERIFLQTVVNTLTEFDSIETVKITFDGKSVTAMAHGTNVDREMRQFLLNPQNVDMETMSQGVNTVCLYVPDSTCRYTVPVTAYTAGENNFETAMEQFCECCENVGCGLPEGTHILSAAMTDGTCAVNFSPEFSQVLETGDGVYDAIYKAIYLTAKGYGDVSEVKIFSGSQIVAKKAPEVTDTINEW